MLLRQLLFVIVIAALSGPAVAEDTPRRAVPAADAQKESEKLIRDLFKEEYARTDAPGLQSLAAKLLQQAAENRNDPASEFVLLREARDAAIRGGDGPQATSAQERLIKGYVTDFAVLLAELRKLETLAKTPETAAAMTELVAACGDAALAVADYDHAVKFYARAELLLSPVKDMALRNRVKVESARMQAIKRESVAALAAQKTLATSPDDADANLVAGRFALLSSELEKSLPLLAKGRDEAFKSLATRELANPEEASAQAQLADAWFERAEKESVAYIKPRLQQRAAYWYSAASPKLTGLQKLKVDDRLKTLGAGVAKVETKPVATKPVEPPPEAKREETKRDENKGAGVAAPVIPPGKVGRGLWLTIDDKETLWQNTALDNLPNNRTPVSFTGFLILPPAYKTLQFRSGTPYGGERFRITIGGETLKFGKENNRWTSELVEKQFPRRVELHIGKSIAQTDNWKWGPLEWCVDGKWSKVPLENLEAPAKK